MQVKNRAPGEAGGEPFCRGCSVSKLRFALMRGGVRRPDVGIGPYDHTEGIRSGFVGAAIGRPPFRGLGIAAR